MKKTICLLLLVVLVFTSGCAQASPSETESAAQGTANPDRAEIALTALNVRGSGGDTEETSPADQAGTVKYYIPEMEATISVPEEYSVFGKDVDYSDEMCREADITPSQMSTYLALSFDQAVIIPRGDSFAEPSIKICVKVKDNKYSGVNMAELSNLEYTILANAIISGFSTDYSTLEKNGMRFMVFDWKGPTGMSYRYATIINGDMIYVYASVPGSEITQEQRELLESIATSIEPR